MILYRILKTSSSYVFLFYQPFDDIYHNQFTTTNDATECENYEMQDLGNTPESNGVTTNVRRFRYPRSRRRAIVMLIATQVIYWGSVLGTVLGSYYVFNNVNDAE